MEENINIENNVSLGKTETNNPTKLNTIKRAMIKALEKSLGIVTTAAKNVGIDRSTHYLWLQQDELYKEQVESISDMALDFAESKLHQQIGEGAIPSTIFYLKTKGRRRGYIEQTNLDHTTGGEKFTAPQPLIVYSTAPPLAQSENEIEKKK